MVKSVVMSFCFSPLLCWILVLLKLNKKSSKGKMGFIGWIQKPGDKVGGEASSFYHLFIPV
jgi:hypothetical protein